MKFIGLFLFSLFSIDLIAQEALPEGCKPFLIESAHAVLSTESPAVMLLHNISEIDLWITHPITEPSASAGFSSRLRSNHWSALVLTEHGFEISCIESKPGHEQQVSCEHVLAVCKWGQVTIPKKMEATLWAAEDRPLHELFGYLGRRGFVLN